MKTNENERRSKSNGATVKVEWRDAAVKVEWRDAAVAAGG
jgi:hypothetical protein